MTKQCYLAMVSIKASMKEVQLIEDEIKVLEDVGWDPEAKVVEELIRYELNGRSSDCFFLTSANLEERERIELIQFLKANIEVFTWTPYGMPGINPNFIKHELNVVSDARLVKQRGKRSVPEHVYAVIEKVKKLKEASAIAEVFYLSWLSNIVAVKKNGGSVLIS